ncbi:uncharacterized protein LOC129808562 [Phlebotomus papatasi]|uniref:uncharacterized protein LOC129808562 n=1 Tax=Phlebotomus papatasi TaxID=29031 RepID=UPI0024835705|nr:uncharacterized protein LOC129808562 [Phlebotomus papatasi]
MEAKFLMEEKLKELSSDDDKTQHPVSDGQSSDEDDAEARSSSDNYKAALKMLKERYDNKREIIMSHIDILTDMKEVGQNSATDIITLHDQINEALEGLIRDQGCCTENWDPLIIGFAIKKLDADALRYLEELLPDPTEMPTLAQFMTFLRKRHRVLKANDKEDSGDPESKKKGTKKETVKKSLHLTSKMACFLCKEAHGITNCPKFQELTSYNKRQTAFKLDLYLSCLSHKKDKECKSKRNCQHCDQKHHTLLHYEKKSQAKETKPKKTDALVLSTDNQEEQKDSEEFEDSEHVSLHTSSTSPLFPTILMKARANGGDWHYLPALLDTGSGDSFISERAAQELSLPRERINAPIRGIGGSAAAVSKHQVQIILAPRFPSTYKLEVGALVLSSLTGLLPQQPIKTDSYKGLKVDNILMADPTFMTPGPIDMILGAQIYASILKNGIKRSNTTSAQNTEFGWNLTGSHSQKKLPESKIISMISMAEIDRKLQLFWEMDQHTELHRVLHRVEKEFAETHSRTEDGRYVVQLPFKGSELGDSKKQAMAHFINMEKKFATNEQLRNDYSEFIHEYISLGHMSLAPPDGGKYYLPHHAVFKKESSTTKTRVAFDASCKTSTGKSLNSVLHAGPKLQQNLNQIIIRWCKYKYVYTADIEKMFRQIIVAEEHRDYLRILWRDSPEQPIREYRLNTVTYGTAPATYLSVKVLMQLAEDEGAQFPAAVAAIKEFYVDDVMTGADTVEGAL